jgi:hypothetical protein
LEKNLFGIGKFRGKKTARFSAGAQYDLRGEKFTFKPVRLAPMGLMGFPCDKIIAAPMTIDFLHREFYL